MDNKNFEGTVASLFNGMTGFMTTKTVVGEAINVNDTIILPLVDVSFGMAAGAKAAENSGNGKESCTGGMGGKMSPSAVLVIKDGTCKLVNIKNQDTVTKLIDMVPDILDKFSKKNNASDEELSDEEIVDVAKNAVENN